MFGPVPPPAASRALVVLPFAGAALLLGLAGLFATARPVLAYVVREGELVVRTALFRRRFALAGRTARVTGVRPGLRLLGTALPGYYTGLFTLEGGRARVYATTFERGVLLDGTPRLFVTPDDADGFVDAVRAAGAR